MIIKQFSWSTDHIKMFENGFSVSVSLFTINVILVEER